MPKYISIKINAELPENLSANFVAYQIFQQMALRADRLESWQEVYAPIGERKIGECHFEITDEE